MLNARGLAWTTDHRHLGDTEDSKGDDALSANFARSSASKYRDNASTYKKDVEVIVDRASVMTGDEGRPSLASQDKPKKGTVQP